MGPHPYPMIVREFQKIIGEEARSRSLKKKEGCRTQSWHAWRGSNAMGIFNAFKEDANVELYGVEAGGKGIETGEHGASLCAGTNGVLHGMYSKILQDKYGQIKVSYSISAGLIIPESTGAFIPGR